MAEVVVTPSGPGAMDVGLMLTDAGERYMVLTFKEPDADPVLVTFTLPLFHAWLDILNKAAVTAFDERSWTVFD